MTGACGAGAVLVLLSPLFSWGYAHDYDFLHGIGVPLVGGFSLPYVATLAIPLLTIAGCAGLVGAARIRAGSRRVARATLIAGIFAGVVTLLAASHVTSSGYCCGSYFEVRGAATSPGVVIASLGSVLMATAGVAALVGNSKRDGGVVVRSLHSRGVGSGPVTTAR